MTLLNNIMYNSIEKYVMYTDFSIVKFFLAQGKNISR